MNWQLGGIWQPSLMRRTVVALLASFVLVLLALIAVDFLDVQSDFEQHLAIKARADAMAPILARISDEREAGLVLRSFAEMFNTRRHDIGALTGSVVYQLRADDGGVITASPEASRETFPAAVGRVSTTGLNGRSHWVVSVAAGAWNLVIAEPANRVPMMLWLSARDVLDKMLVAFPLVLLPVWLAVRTGLRPLRRLAHSVSARSPNDLSPLGIVPPQVELKPLTTAFESLLAKLRHKVQMERSFVQDAAHEMRTPLAAITTQAHVLARTQDEAERKQAELALESMLQRAAHVNQQLLELAALDDGEARTRQRKDVVAILQQALASSAPQAAANNLDLDLETPETLDCSLDVVAFQSIVHNLLDNAMRYTYKGGRIRVRLIVQTGTWVLTVADNGPGMLPEQRLRAFERFWRGEHIDISGSGLGLAIVHQAATRMSATISIEDGLDGRGVEFVLTIPATA